MFRTPQAWLLGLFLAAMAILTFAAATAVLAA